MQVTFIFINKLVPLKFSGTQATSKNVYLERSHLDSVLFKSLPYSEREPNIKNFYFGLVPSSVCYSRRSHFSNNRELISRQKIKMALRAGSSMLLRSLRSSNKMSSRAMSQMSFTFAAPNGVHYNNASVKQIDVPSFSGSFGILPDHVPALAVLSPGVITVFEDSGDAKKFFVSSGTVTINDDSRLVTKSFHS